MHPKKKYQHQNITTPTEKHKKILFFLIGFNIPSVLYVCPYGWLFLLRFLFHNYLLAFSWSFLSVHFIVSFIIAFGLHHFFQSRMSFFTMSENVKFPPKTRVVWMSVIFANVHSYFFSFNLYMNVRTPTLTQA